MHVRTGASVCGACQFGSTVLHCVALCCSVDLYQLYCSVLHCVALCCSVNVYQLYCSVLQCVAVCCSVLQCVAVSICISFVKRDLQKRPAVDSICFTHTHTAIHAHTYTIYTHTHRHTHTHTHTCTNTEARVRGACDCVSLFLKRD